MRDFMLLKIKDLRELTLTLKWEMRSFTMSDESSKSLLMLLVILKMSLDFPLTQKLLNLKQL